MAHKKGTILKGISGFYSVRDKKGEIFECKACGRFRNEGMVPLSGDFVEFSIDADKKGYIENISPRRNELKRPKVANIDTVAIVACVRKPKPDCLLIDKLIIEAQRAQILPLLVINKCDTAKDSDITALRKQYEKACETLCVSAYSGKGLDALKDRLRDGLTCFAGQSAVGKSSLLNALFASLDLQTGDLSKKTDRGRHTTRHAELLVLDDICGMVVDTPGFSFLESGSIDPEELFCYYSDMRPYAKGCRFTSCLHADEPDCGVKEAVGKGLINQERYTRYLLILKELKDRRAKEYD